MAVLDGYGNSLRALVAGVPQPDRVPGRPQPGGQPAQAHVDAVCRRDGDPAQLDKYRTILLNPPSVASGGVDRNAESGALQLRLVMDLGIESRATRARVARSCVPILVVAKKSHRTRSTSIRGGDGPQAPDRLRDGLTANDSSVKTGSPTDSRARLRRGSR